MARGRLNSSNKPEAELPKAKLNRETLRKVSGLLAYLKPYRWKFTGALLFLFLSGLVGLAFPSYIGALIDTAQGKHKACFLPGTIGGISGNAAHQCSSASCGSP